jgi:hypothetical protein
VLLSSQAVSVIVIDGLWALDAGARLVTGRHLIGGTEYMWDVRYPLAVRLMSLFHAVWPFLLVWSLRRVGYDRRGLYVQIGVAALIFVLSRLVGDPVRNHNYVFRDPFFGETWGPAPGHLALMFVVLVVAVYLPTDWVLRCWWRKRSAANPASPGG